MTLGKLFTCLCLLTHVFVSRQYNLVHCSIVVVFIIQVHSYFLKCCVLILLVCACPVCHCVICFYAIRSLDCNFPINTYLHSKTSQSVAKPVWENVIDSLCLARNCTGHASDVSRYIDFMSLVVYGRETECF